MAHIQEILRALHLDTIHTEYYSFRSKNSSQKVQIDLVIDRSDDDVDIVEIRTKTPMFVSASWFWMTSLSESHFIQSSLFQG